MYNLLLLYVLKQQGTFTSLKAKGQPLHLCRRLIETLSVSKEKHKSLNTLINKIKITL